MNDVEIRYTYYKLSCPKCGRRSLVEVLVGATPEGNAPSMDVQIICSVCLIAKGLDKEFKQNYPEIAKDMETWLKVDKTGIVED